MATRRQVTCVVKADRDNPWEAIERIGGTGWSVSQPEAIRQIEARTHSYYVSSGGRTVEVIVATREGHKYLKTENDDYRPNNLLSLPRCS